MTEIEELIAKLRDLGDEWWCPGPTDEADVAALERGLGLRLPEDYRQFLLAYGGGGVEAVFELCQLERGNPLDQCEGSVYGQTMHDRRELGLPATAVVILRDDDDVHVIDVARGPQAPVSVYLVEGGESRDWEPGFNLYLGAWLRRLILEAEEHNDES